MAKTRAERHWSPEETAESEKIIFKFEQHFFHHYNWGSGQISIHNIQASYGNESYENTAANTQVSFKPRNTRKAIENSFKSHFIRFHKELQ